MPGWPQTELISKAANVNNGSDCDVLSPTGKASIVCKGPKEGEDYGRLLVRSGQQVTFIEPIVRSGQVFWRPDGKLAIFDDDRGSDHSEFLIIRVEPEIKQIKSAYRILLKRWRSEFRVGEVSHDYTRAEGWLNGKDLLVTVTADGLPLGKTEGPTIGFCRGYVLDTETTRIKRELSRDRLRTEFRLKDVCW